MVVDGNKNYSSILNLPIDQNSNGTESNNHQYQLLSFINASSNIMAFSNRHTNMMLPETFSWFLYITK